MSQNIINGEGRLVDWCLDIRKLEGGRLDQISLCRSRRNHFSYIQFVSVFRFDRKNVSHNWHVLQCRKLYWVFCLLYWSYKPVHACNPGYSTNTSLIATSNSMQCHCRLGAERLPLCQPLAIAHSLRLARVVYRCTYL